jgi:hypothetical protein
VTASLNNTATVLQQQGRKRSHFEDISIGRKIILIWIFKK